MDQSPKPSYSITHKPPGETNVVENVINGWAKQMKADMTKMLDTFGEGQFAQAESIEDNDAKLLDLRKKLVRYIREGMYERKDKEIEIGWLAMSIWFNRMEFEKQANLLAGF